MKIEKMVKVEIKGVNETILSSWIQEDPGSPLIVGLGDGDDLVIDREQAAKLRIVIGMYLDDSKKD